VKVWPFASVTDVTLEIPSKANVVAFPNALGTFVRLPVLLLGITISGTPSNGGQFLDAMNGDARGLFSRATDCCTGGTIDWGLVTRFDAVQSSVPEPSSLLLFGTVLVGVAVTVKRKLPS
jgi:hypothetical protein